MSKVIGILIILGLAWGGSKLYTYWKKVERKSGTNALIVEVDPNAITGLDSSFEPSLQTAKQGGAAGLKTWLAQNRRNCKDPRLAAIELDYVVLVNKSDPAEAKRVFSAVKTRIPTTSPLYPRIRQLSQTYE